MCRNLLVLAALGVFAFSPVALARTFTDNQGNKINAKFIRVHEGKVILNRGGRVVTVPFSNLSPQDQDYIRGEMEAKGKGDLGPSRSRRPGLDDRALPGLELVESPDREADRTPSVGRMGAPRTWTDARGRTVEAQFAGMSGDKVVLAKQGRRSTFPLEGLSAADQQYVREQMVARGQGHLVPGAPGAPGAATGPMPGMPGSMPGMAGPMPGMPGSMPGMPGTMPGMPGEMPGMAEAMPGMPGEMPGMAGAMPGMPAEMAGMPAGDPAHGMHGQGAPTPGTHMPLGGPSPGISSPPMPVMPTMRTMPDPIATSLPSRPSLPQASIPPGQFSSGVKFCTGCGRGVPPNTQIGDRCPHCGVKFSFEQMADGRVIDAHGTEISLGWYRIGGAGGLAAIVGAAIALLARLFRGRD